VQRRPAGLFYQREALPHAVGNALGLPQMVLKLGQRFRSPLGHFVVMAGRRLPAEHGDRLAVVLDHLLHERAVEGPSELAVRSVQTAIPARVRALVVKTGVFAERPRGR